MIKIIRFFFISILFLSYYSFAGVNIDVRVFSDKKTESFWISPETGKYMIYGNNNDIIPLSVSDTIFFCIDSNRISIHDKINYYGESDSIRIIGQGFINSLFIGFNDKNEKISIYNDNLKVSISDSSLKIINRVDIEKYIAGVVEAESGYLSSELEYYKVQAIISRTYGIQSRKKHLHEGFNLCDQVHCQVYHGKSTNDIILRATYKTYGDVIIDKNNNVISSAFHSNSGGETVNSEHVWTYPRTYLKSVNDTFALNMRNSKWEKTMKTEEWMHYLATKHNYNVNDSNKVVQACNFSQKSRKIMFPGQIPLKEIRSGLKLRSTFFSIEQKGDNIYFKGRGYGHGVGLCQEGAMKMAKMGANFNEIIRFYYTDVKIVNFEEIISN